MITVGFILRTGLICFKYKTDIFPIVHGDIWKKVRSKPLLFNWPVNIILPVSQNQRGRNHSAKYNRNNRPWWNCIFICIFGSKIMQISMRRSLLCLQLKNHSANHGNSVLIRSQWIETKKLLIHTVMTFKWTPEKCLMVRGHLI